MNSTAESTVYGDSRCMYLNTLQHSSVEQQPNKADESVHTNTCLHERHITHRHDKSRPTPTAGAAIWRTEQPGRRYIARLA